MQVKMAHVYAYIYESNVVYYHRVIGKLMPGQGKFKQSKMPFVQVKI